MTMIMLYLVYPANESTVILFKRLSPNYSEFSTYANSLKRKGKSFQPIQNVSTSIVIDPNLSFRIPLECLDGHNVPYRK